MRVLGIDPGYAIVGWGVVDYAGNRFAPVDFGAVCTDAGVPFERRLDEVYAGIKEVIERTRPEVLAIEKLFYQHNQTTVIGVAEARRCAGNGHHLLPHQRQPAQPLCPPCGRADLTLSPVPSACSGAAPELSRRAS